MKLLPVQRHYTESLVVRFCSYDLFLIPSEQFWLMGQDWLLGSVTEAGPHTSQESALPERRSTGALLKADTGWEQVILKTTPRGLKRASPIGPKISVPAYCSAGKKLSHGWCHRAARGRAEQRGATQLVCLGSSWRLLAEAKAERKPPTLPPSSEAAGTWPPWKGMTLLQTHIPVGGT